MKKYYYLSIIKSLKKTLLIIWSSILILYANTTADSLKTIIANTNRLRALDSLAAEKTAPDSLRLGYALQAVSLAEEMAAEDDKAKSYLTLGLVQYDINDYIESNKNLETSYYIYAELLDSAQMAFCSSKLAGTNRKLATYAKSLQWYFTSFNICKKIKDQTGVSRAANGIGTVYKRLCNYDKALEYYLISHRIDQSRDDDHGIAITANNIGNIYLKLGNLDRASKYYSISLEKTLSGGNDAGLADIYTNIGIVHRRSGRYDQALEYYEKALAIDKENNNKTGIAISLNNIGMVYSNLSRYDLALKHFARSLELHQKLNNHSQVAGTCNNMAFVYIQTKHYRQAELFLDKGLKIALSIGEKELISENYLFTFQLHTAKANYKEALNNYQLHTNIKDSIFTEQSLERIARLRTEYELETKEKQNQLLRQSNAIQKLELSKQITFRNSLILIFLLVLVMLLFSFRQSRFKSKANSLLNEKNSEIGKRNKELQAAMAQIKQLKGFLPICSSCKKIRDDKGYWSEVEVYIRDHTDVNFSHGICPDCFERLYPDFVKKKETPE